MMTIRVAVKLYLQQLFCYHSYRIVDITKRFGSQYRLIGHTVERKCSICGKIKKKNETYYQE